MLNIMQLPDVQLDTCQSRRQLHIPAEWGHISYQWSRKNTLQKLCLSSLRSRVEKEPDFNPLAYIWDSLAEKVVYCGRSEKCTERELGPYMYFSILGIYLPGRDQEVHWPCWLVEKENEQAVKTGDQLTTFFPDANAKRFSLG
jgi:hypothetical protein